MSETPIFQEPQAPILKRNGFQFRNGVLSIDTIERVDGSRLHELFNPSTLRHPRDQRDAAKKAQKLFRKTFFAAQLRFYEIPFKSSSSKTQLQLLLQDAVRQSKCNRVPQSVVELETSMRADYEPLQKEWEADYAVWSAEKKRRDDKAFELAKSPSERAALDPQRFIDTYFLTDGKPDMTKTKKALALHNLQNVRKFEDMARRRVPGLHTWGGFDPLDPDIYIGWNLEEVLELAKSTADHKDKADKAQIEALWEQQLEKHQKYIAQAQLKEPSKGANKHSKGFSLDRCKGSYVIRCEEITNEWLSILKGHTLTMDICSRDENTLCAAFDFGIIEGTMILSLSEAPLKADPSEPNRDLEARSSDEELDDIGLQEDNDLQNLASGRKRKVNEASLSAVQHANAKRRETSVPEFLSRRVYFRLRGRSTSEGDVISVLEAGHLNFRSDDCVEFSGLVYLLSWVGKNVWFRGYKVSDTPRVEPEDWDTFPLKSGFEYINSNVKYL